MKQILILLIVFVTINSFGNQRDSDSLNLLHHQKLKFEFFVLPAVLYNTIRIGLSYRHSNKVESLLTISSHIDALYSFSFGTKIGYGFNTYLANHKWYIPTWIDIRNVRRDVGYEEGYFPHKLKFSLGSGVGRVNQLSKNWKLRTELGFGVSSLQTNSKGGVFELTKNFKDYKFDTYYPQYYPHFVPSIEIKLLFNFNTQQPQFELGKKK